jgi:hypothetical protein
MWGAHEAVYPLGQHEVFADTSPTAEEGTGADAVQSSPKAQAPDPLPTSSEELKALLECAPSLRALEALGAHVKVWPRACRQAAPGGPATHSCLQELKDASALSEEALSELRSLYSSRRLLIVGFLFGDVVRVLAHSDWCLAGVSSARWNRRALPWHASRLPEKWNLHLGPPHRPLPQVRVIPTARV